MDEPARELAGIRMVKGQFRFDGDAALWQHLDPAVIINTPAGSKLLLIDAPESRVINLDLDWFTNGNYDFGYQGLADCMLLGSIHRVIVSVQRSSTLVVIDPDRNQMVGSISLSNRGGNPSLQMRAATDFLASDYDTLCRVDVGSLSVVRSARLQGASAPHTRQFIGEFDIAGGLCAVARPFSGDVLLLDSEDFKVRGRAQLGGQPLALSLISESRVIARDWKTGKVSIGQIQLERK